MALDETIEAPDEAFEIAERCPAENIASDRGESRHRSVCQVNGEYEFATARHYVPRLPSPTADASDGIIEHFDCLYLADSDV